MTKEQKETELTPEMEKQEQAAYIVSKLCTIAKLSVKSVLMHSVEMVRFVKSQIDVNPEAIKKETEQSLKQKVEKMLEGLIKQNEEAPPADKEEEIDERTYRQALEEAKNNLEDL